MGKIVAIVVAVIAAIMLIIAATKKPAPNGEPPPDDIPPSGEGSILEFSIEPKQIYQQEEVAIRTKVKNTSGVGEMFYTRVYIDNQWSGSIISKWLNSGEVYEDSSSPRLYNAGTFTATCYLTGYEKEDVRDKAYAQVTVLSREFPDMLTLLPEPAHLYDFTLYGSYRGLQFPPGADPRLLLTPKAYFKGTEFAMDIQYSLLPNLISDKRRKRTGWYWEVHIFNEGDVYNLPFYPTSYGGTRPKWRKYFGNQSLSSASISKWEPLLEINTDLFTHQYPEPPTDLYPESEGWFFKLLTGQYGAVWIAYRYLKDTPGRHPVVIVAWYDGIISDSRRFWRAWKVGEIVVPPKGQMSAENTTLTGYYHTTWEEM